MFGGLSLPHVLIVALVILVLFGKGRISEMMGDFGKGIKSFKDGMGDDAASRAAAADAALRVSPPPQIAASVQPGVVPPVAANPESLNVGGQGQA